MKSGIYTIEAPSGARYIGSAVNLQQRRRAHFSGLRRGVHRNSRLQRGYDKHGESLKFRILFICTQDDLIFFEQRAINAYEPGYNIALVAGSSFGLKRSDEYRSKKSVSMNGRKDSPETREKKRIALIGRPVSEETRKKLSAQKGWKHSEASKQKMSGRPKTEKQISKSSKRHRGNQYRKGAIVPAEIRLRISAKLKGRLRSPESIKKHRATLAARRAAEVI